MNVDQVGIELNSLNTFRCIQGSLCRVDRLIKPFGTIGKGP